MDPELARQYDELPSAVLGSRIKAARLAAGLTQPELGGTYASVAYVSRIERGERRPNLTMLEAFAARLGVTARELIQGYETADTRQVELELDYAELALTSGDGAASLERIENLLKNPLLGDIAGAAQRAHYLRAAALDSLGDPGASEAFETLLVSGVELGVALACATALSRIYRERGELKRATVAAQNGLDLIGETELAGGEESLRLQVTLAAALYETGAVDDALAMCETAIADAEAISSNRARAAAYWNASVIHSEAGELGRALDLARRALHLLEGEDGVRDLARMRNQFALTLLRVDPPQLASAREQVLIARRELEWSSSSVADKAGNTLLVARVHFLSSETDLARQQAAEVVEMSQVARLPLVEVAGQALLGQIAWADRDVEASRRHYTRAIQVLTGIGADREAGQLWFDLASLLDEAGLTSESKDAYMRAATATGLGMRHHVLRVGTQAPAPDLS